MARRRTTSRVGRHLAPCLFRLFRKKRRLYLATTERSIAELNGFTTAAAGKTGRRGARAMGDAYTARMSTDRDRLMLC